MKKKLHVITALAVCAALSFTACGGSTSASSAPAASISTAVSEAASGDASATIDDLFQQENQLFADHADVAQDASPFKNFSATDFDGNTVDDTLFSNNAVTVMNFWFTGCKPCVGELSKLNELNETLKAMGGEVVGVNTETFDGNESAIADAKKVLESQNAAYRNLSLNLDSEAGKYASGIMAFPTTILVDRNGNIVGEPLLGGIDIQENYDALMQQIQSVVDADSANQ